LEISWKFNPVIRFATMRYRVDDFVLDVRRFELRQSDRPLPVEPQVLSLLILLIENRDRLVSKDELIASVWNGRAVSDSAISSRIKSARQLLGDNGDAQRLIRTIHGRGFRFVGHVTAADTNGAGTSADERHGGKPSIAILPFDCTDADLAVICEGVPQELIVGLSRLHSLAVIARGSSFRFRNWPGDLSEVGHILGVRYCLTGSVQRAGSRVAVTVELVDLLTGTIVWGELFEAKAGQLQTVREAIIAHVISTLDVQISRHEADRARLQSPDDLTAWSCYHLGLHHIYRFNNADNSRALKLFQQALALDPNFSRAHSGLSAARFQNAFMRYTKVAAEEAKEARKAAETALELDEQDPTANLMLGRALWLDGSVENSVPWVERAIALNPNYAQAKYSRGWTHMILNEGRAGQNCAQEAMRLSPVDPLRYAMMASDGFTQAMIGNEQAGAVMVDRAAREPRAHVLIAVMAAITQVWAGNREKTDYWRTEISARGSNVTGETFLRSFPFRDGELLTRVTGALSAIGL
jgi:DNA-binding winged helix-turn-helix (wHTH) protein